MSAITLERGTNPSQFSAVAARPDKPSRDAGEQIPWPTKREDGRGTDGSQTRRWRGQSGANPSLLSDFRWIEVQKKSRCNSIVYLATGVLSVRRSGDREFADSLLEGSGFEPRGDPFSGVRRGRFPPNLAGSVPVAMLEEQIYLHAIWFLIVLYLLLIAFLSATVAL